MSFSATSGRSARTEPKSNPGDQRDPAGQRDPGDGSWLDRKILTRLEPMLEMLATSPVSLSSVTDPGRARKVHVIDSLSGLILPEVSSAATAIDIGAGAGFPGIPLAAARPDATFTLLDSVGRKVEFMNEVISALGLENIVAVKARSEDWARGNAIESSDLVTARAVAPLEALAELASPLLTAGGSLVAWKGEREPEGEERLARLRLRLAMELDRVVPVVPYPGSRERHFYVVKKTGPTPDGLPRRAGMVRKRPLAD